MIGLPGSSKPLTQFDVVQLGAERVLRVRADHSYANLSHRLPGTATGRLQWRWRLDQPVRDADLRTRRGDDIPIKVCALFDLPLEKLGFMGATCAWPAVPVVNTCPAPRCATSGTRSWPWAPNCPARSRSACRT